MTDTSALIEGHYLVSSYPAAWCQCGHHVLRWNQREEEHAVHVIAAIQAQALRDEAYKVAPIGTEARAEHRARLLRSAARLTEGNGS